jgi:hypothetical protein
VPIVVTPRRYIIGPAYVYYRDVGVLTPWTSAGATLDDAVMRVMTEWFRPDNLSGVMGNVMGLDVLRRVDAEIEFTLGEIAGTSLGLAVPGARTTAAVSADAGGSPWSSTISAAAAAGATTITATATTNAAVGDFFRIETAAHANVEYRQITAISGSDVSFRDPLLYAHTASTVVVETTGDKRDLIEAPTIRRQPDSAYKEWALVMDAGMQNTYELRIPRGMSHTESVDMTVADDALTGVRVTIGARYLGSDLTASPFKLYAPALA